MPHAARMEPDGSYDDYRAMDDEEDYGEEMFERDDMTAEMFSLDDEMDEDDEHDFLALEDGAYRSEVLDKEKTTSEHRSRINVNARSKVRSFAIFDKELASLNLLKEEEEDDLFAEEDAAKASAAAAPKTAASGSRFRSQAEQDLYEALRRRKSKRDNS
jgi:hypothetical protein